MRTGAEQNRNSVLRYMHVRCCVYASGTLDGGGFMKAAVQLMLECGGDFAKGIARQWLKADAKGRKQIEELHEDTFVHYAMKAEKYSAFNQGVEL